MIKCPEEEQSETPRCQKTPLKCGNKHYIDILSCVFKKQHGNFKVERFDYLIN